MDSSTNIMDQHHTTLLSQELVCSMS